MEKVVVVDERVVLKGKEARAEQVGEMVDQVGEMVVVKDSSQHCGTNS